MKKHKVEDIESLIAGTSVSADLKIYHDTFSMSAIIRSQDVLLQLQLGGLY
ncbi:MAG: hypothetical protein HRT91_00545 [Piscirickettsiaceae bacterium]|nr:hypothetical protein [Piscirickettsiaceae bacterium]